MTPDTKAQRSLERPIVRQVLREGTVGGELHPLVIKTVATLEGVDPDALLKAWQLELGLPVSEPQGRIYCSADESMRRY